MKYRRRPEYTRLRNRYGDKSAAHRARACPASRRLLVGPSIQWPAVFRKEEGAAPGGGRMLCSSGRIVASLVPELKGEFNRRPFWQVASSRKTRCRVRLWRLESDKVNPCALLQEHCRSSRLLRPSS